MVAVLDTNVVFAALRSRSGASHQILRLAFDGDLTVGMSNTLCLEYLDVLLRPENQAVLGIDREDILAVVDALVVLSRRQSVWFRLRPNLRDEGDNMVAECAWACNADVLITHNTRDFRGGELDGLGIVVRTPRQFMQWWRTEK